MLKNVFNKKTSVIVIAEVFYVALNLSPIKIVGSIGHFFSLMG